MSKITNRDAALERLLDTPFLARVVPHLPAEALHQLIRSHGLDACSELIMSATPAQLTSVLDLDLWQHPRPGHDEHFDVERFGEWVEALVDAGPSIAARTVAVLDKDLVILGLSRYVRVFDPGIFEPVAQSDDEPVDRAEAMREGDSLEAGESSTDCVECEVAGYIVRARRADAWEAIITLLIALDAGHGNYFRAVMRGCKGLSHSRPEVDGLDDLLQAPEQHLHEVAIERERRRSQQGYATPADARAFLQMARQPKQTRSGSSTINPIVTAYFRAADEEPEPSSASPLRPKSLPSAASEPADAGAHSTGDSESLEAIMELLTEAGVMPERPRALLEGGDADPQAARLTHLRRLMAYVRDRDEIVYLTRSRELAFLANTLAAGCSVQSRPFTPQEASDAGAAICNLGFEHWPARWPRVTSPRTRPDTVPPDSWLIDHDLVTAFEVGWSVVYQDVSLFAAKQLISTLGALHCVDRDIQRDLIALRRTLATQLKAGTPWLARGAAEILATLDTTAWISVLGLLDECPVIPAALTAILEHRTTTVSPTEFEFIATAAQIGDVRTFMRTLPDVLSR
jgi:hypothetical protein